MMRGRSFLDGRGVAALAGGGTSNDLVIWRKKHRSRA